MNESNEKKGTGNRILAFLYVISIYASLIGSMIWIDKDSDVPLGCILSVMAVPILIWICCIIYNKKNYEVMDRKAMFDAVILMKYLMIPLFVVGGFCVCAMALLSFIPVVFMIFVGPVAVIILCVMGWCYMVSGLAFSLPYFKKVREEQAYGAGLTVLATICQFFFGLDVLTFMLLTLKEKRWAKLTIVSIVIAIIIVLALIVWALLQSRQ